MSKPVITPAELEARYKTVSIRTEETQLPFSEEKAKRYVVDLRHDGSIYYVHIEFSPSGTTYCGDMGSFMFQHGYGVGTFKGDTINPRYWGEKVSAAGEDFYVREFDMELVDRAYKEAVLSHYEYEWEKTYFEEAKKAWEMSDADFNEWYAVWHERDDEDVGPEWAEEVERVRDAGKPSDYADRSTEESAYDAVERTAKYAELDWDFEAIGSIASGGKRENYRFLYACCVLQWVANKIVQMKSETDN